MAYIALTKGKMAEVDEADFALVSGIKWHAHRDWLSGSFRAMRHVPGTRNKTEELSCFLVGKRDGYVLDHKNRNQLDYRRENLRWATKQENCRNRIRKSSLCPGVFRNGAKFSSRINIGNGIRKFLGSFDTKEAAHQAYVLASKQHFGEFSPFAHV